MGVIDIHLLITAEDKKGQWKWNHDGDYQE